MNRIPFDITFHPSWWHKNAGIDFSQPFFDDYKYRMECDVRMRREGRADEGKISISCVGMDVNTPEESILAFLDACRAANA